MATTTSLFFILSTLLLSFTPSPTLAQSENNVMFTGDILPNEGRLTYGTSNLIMQNDCNLVLHGGQRGFQSNTAGSGEDCTLRLDDHGTFIIQDNNGQRIYQSTPDRQTPRGEYVAMVRPDGEVAIYGPLRYSSRSRHLSTVSQTAALPNNVMFSGDILSRNARLNAGDASLVMTDDCRLILEKGNSIIWTPPSFNRGEHCFLHLNHRGRMTIVDDEIQALLTLPETNEMFEHGEYALVLRSDGVFGVYGPRVWSTPNSRLSARKTSLKMSMVIA